MRLGFRMTYCTSRLTYQANLDTTDEKRERTLPPDCLPNYSHSAPRLDHCVVDNALVRHFPTFDLHTRAFGITPHDLFTGLERTVFKF